MEFTVSTKPLKAALNLAIVGKNINRLHQKSTVVQLTMSTNDLRINTEASQIKTEVTLKGSGDGNATIIVDAVILKNLVSTLNANQVTIEFQQNQIIIHAGRSDFNIPKLVDTDEVSLDRPYLENISVDSGDYVGTVDKAAWNFLANHQMFALQAPGTAYPVYQNIWLGDNGDSLAGDFRESLFAHSGKCGLGATCLINDSIVNLLCSVPDNSHLYRVEETYVIYNTEDSFDYRAEFSPKQENDENGNYRADLLLQKLSIDNAPTISIKVSDISTILGQIALLSDREIVVSISIEKDHITFKGRNINAVIDADGDIGEIKDKKFKISTLKKIIANLPDASVKIAPAMNNGVNVGLVFVSGDLTVICAYSV